MSNSPKQPWHSILTPAVERASSDFIEATGRALEIGGLSVVEAQQQIDALLGELWEACEPITDQLFTSSGDERYVDEVVL
jgi:hypothetical protein